MTDCELLESNGWREYSAKQCGMIRNVWWINLKTQETETQGVAAMRLRQIISLKRKAAKQ